MKKRKENAEIERCCARCEFATLLSQCDCILCAKKGIVSETYVCRRFVYDPLKRAPKRLPLIPKEETDEIPNI
jgi:hypothetical protein